MSAVLQPHYKSVKAAPAGGISGWRRCALRWGLQYASFNGAKKGGEVGICSRAHASEVLHLFVCILHKVSALR